MTARTTDSIFKDVVKNKSIATKRRISALESMARPSIRFLSALASDATNPARLRMVAVERLEVQVQLRRAMKKLAAKETCSDREQSNTNAEGSDGQSAQ